MKIMTKLSLKDGGTILVETDQPRYSEGDVRVSKANNIIDKTEVEFEIHVAKIKPVTYAIIPAPKQPIYANHEVEVPKEQRVTSLLSWVSQTSAKSSSPPPSAVLLALQAKPTDHSCQSKLKVSRLALVVSQHGMKLGDALLEW